MRAIAAEPQAQAAQAAQAPTAAGNAAGGGKGAGRDRPTAAAGNGGSSSTGRSAHSPSSFRALLAGDTLLWLCVVMNTPLWIDAVRTVSGTMRKRTMRSGSFPLRRSVTRVVLAARAHAARRRASRSPSSTPAWRPKSRSGDRAGPGHLAAPSQLTQPQRRSPRPAKARTRSPTRRACCYPCSRKPCGRMPRGGARPARRPWACPRLACWPGPAFRRLCPLQRAWCSTASERVAYVPECSARLC